MVGSYSDKCLIQLDLRSKITSSSYTVAVQVVELNRSLNPRLLGHNVPNAILGNSMTVEYSILTKTLGEHPCVGTFSIDLEQT